MHIRLVVHGRRKSDCESFSEQGSQRRSHGACGSFPRCSQGSSCDFQDSRQEDSRAGCTRGWDRPKFARPPDRRSGSRTRERRTLRLKGFDEQTPVSAKGEGGAAVGNNAGVSSRPCGSSTFGSRRQSIAVFPPEYERNHGRPTPSCSRSENGRFIPVSGPNTGPI